MVDFSRFSKSDDESQRKRKIFHLIGGIISIAQLVIAIFLVPVRLVSQNGDYVQMTWDVQFGSSFSVPNPNVTYLDATSQVIGMDLSFLQPYAGFLIPQVLILVAGAIFLVTLVLRVFEVPVVPAIIGKFGSLACLAVLLMVYSVLTVSGALPYILSNGIDYISTILGSFGLLLVFTGATSGLGS